MDYSSIIVQLQQRVPIEESHYHHLQRPPNGDIAESDVSSAENVCMLKCIHNIIMYRVYSIVNVILAQKP